MHGPGPTPAISPVVVELVDGGYGDADGVGNGIVVGGLGTGTTDDGEDNEPDDDRNAGTVVSSGGGSGCFIQNAVASPFSLPSIGAGVRRVLDAWGLN